LTNVVAAFQGRDRDHMARHYINELTELVNALPVRGSCNMCDYKHQKSENMAKHLGLYHCKLDELLQVKRKTFSDKKNRIMHNISIPKWQARNYLINVNQILGFNDTKNPKLIHCVWPFLSFVCKLRTKLIHKIDPRTKTC
jgi:hypothetical protein